MTGLFVLEKYFSTIKIFKKGKHLKKLFVNLLVKIIELLILTRDCSSCDIKTFLRQIKISSN